MKEAIEPLAAASHILQALPGGILLTTRSGQRVNTMTIAWGTLGIDWGLPMFITFVRTSRLSYEFLQDTPEFTINVPTGPIDRRILGIAGTKSGRDMDKISGLGLHLEAPEKISVPGIRELPLTLECRVVYKQAQDPAAIPQKLRDTYHPATGTDLTKALNRTYHTAFYGEIVAAYIIH
ncbi:MAG: flavin reductase family protein [Desulfovibrio sp.]|nr:flavin reductase family protein [Desulfovibrio sp.]